MLYLYTLTLSFQILLPGSRPMTSHHVTCHVTTMTCPFLSSKRKSKKRKESKININLENLNKRKEKLSVSKVFHNTIINHASIGKYRLRFFPKENFSCSCSLYPIESWQYILYDCRRFNNYWNLRRDSIGHFILFLEFNSRAFSFKKNFIILSISTPL